MKALLIILLILMVFLLIPVGIDGGYRENSLVLGLKIGSLNIKIFPREKSPAAEKKVKKAKKKELYSEEAPEQKKEKSDISQIMDIIKLALRALGRFKRKLSIDYFRFYCAIATSDPFSTAMYYGAASAAIEALFPLLDDSFNIKEKDFGVTPDFLTDKTRLDVWITATLHILDLFYIAVAFGIEYLMLKIKQKRSTPKEERNEANG